MIGQAFYEQLRATASITKLCDNIYPDVIPEEGGPPAITYTVDAGERDQQLDGTGPYRFARIRVDAYTVEYVKSWAIADAIETALVDYRGALGKAASAVTCDHLRLERAPFDIFEPQTQLRRVSMQFTVGYYQG